MSKVAKSEPEMWAVFDRNGEVAEAGPHPEVLFLRERAEILAKEWECAWPEYAPFTVKRVRIEVIEK